MIKQKDLSEINKNTISATVDHNIRSGCDDSIDPSQHTDAIYSNIIIKNVERDKLVNRRNVFQSSKVTK